MRYIFVLLLLCSNANASKIVYSLNGEQRVVDVGEGGGVTTDAQVIWDERIHGELPQDVPPLHADREDYEDPIFKPDGSPQMLPSRNEKGEVVTAPRLDEKGEPVLDERGNPVNDVVYSNVQATKTKHRLKLNQAKVDFQLAKKAAKEAQDAQDALDKTAFQALKAKIKDDTATAADVRKALKHLLKKLGE